MSIEVVDVLVYERDEIIRILYAIGAVARPCVINVVTSHNLQRLFNLDAFRGIKEANSSL